MLSTLRGVTGGQVEELLSPSGGEVWECEAILEGGWGWGGKPGRGEERGAGSWTQAGAGYAQATKKKKKKESREISLSGAARLWRSVRNCIASY